MSHGTDESLRYNEAQFKASHNSYDNTIKLGPQLQWHETKPADFGCRSLELDLVQSGDQERFSVNHSLRFHADGPQFSKYLEKLMTWSDQAERDVTTITLDLKRIRRRERLAKTLDAYIAQHFDADRIFRPRELMLPGLDLVKSANERGWPTLGELKGKFIFVLSGSEKAKRHYAQNNVRKRLCFSDRLVRPGTTGVASARGNRIFLNFSMGDARKIPDTDITERGFSKWGVNLLFKAIVETKGFVTRGFGFDRKADWVVGKQLGINILATDALEGTQWAKVGDAPFGERGFRELG